jgi:hypothetical protein
MLWRSRCLLLHSRKRTQSGHSLSSRLGQQRHSPDIVESARVGPIKGLVATRGVRSPAVFNRSSSNITLSVDPVVTI